MVCKCGSKKFICNFTYMGDAFVDEYGEWIKDVKIYESDFYGPYRCAKCGKEYSQDEFDKSVVDQYASKDIIESYEGGVCPDCGEKIPDNVIEGICCDNCGHVFHKERKCDSMSITGLGLELVGSDGNAFAILGKAMKVMKRAGFSKEKIKEFRKEATSGDYDNLLRVCSNWFDVS